MAFRVRLEPGGETFDIREDESILDAALRARILLPYGCREGHCGACRGTVLSGEIDHDDSSLAVLPARDRAAGQALFCRARARSDLRLAARAPLSAAAIPARTLPVRVEKLTRAAPDVMLIDLKLPGSEALTYLPGQYVEILIGGGRRRVFSLASPSGSGVLQLHVRRVPDGEFTGHVFDGMKERDLLRINGPHGAFFLREESTKPMLLVASGTGFAPIKAIVETLLARGSSRPMTLYWGGRHRRDLYLDALVAGWAAAHPSFRYVPVLSAPDADDAWSGRCGRLPAAVMQDFPDLSGFQVYVCGVPAMVRAAREDFVGRCALPEHEFIADAFEFANDAADVRHPSVSSG